MMRTRLVALPESARMECDDVRLCEIASNRSPLVWDAVAAASAATRPPYHSKWLRSARTGSIVADLRASRPFDLVQIDTFGLDLHAGGLEEVPLVLSHQSPW